jgi:hypothetical protein
MAHDIKEYICIAWLLVLYTYSLISLPNVFFFAHELPCYTYSLISLPISLDSDTDIEMNKKIADRERFKTWLGVAGTRLVVS